VINPPLLRTGGGPKRKPRPRIRYGDKGEAAVEEMEAAGRALNEEPGASEVGHPTSASADCNRIGALVALSSPSEACASRTGRCSREGAPPKSSPGSRSRASPASALAGERLLLLALRQGREKGARRGGIVEGQDGQVR
jgi:hypothetical protein